MFESRKVCPTFGKVDDVFFTTVPSYYRWGTIKVWSSGSDEWATKILEDYTLLQLHRSFKVCRWFIFNTYLTGRCYWRFDKKKGFFCQVVNGDSTKCLGRSKGRQYPPMEEKSLKYLQRYYLSHNTALVKLFKKIGIRIIPKWLKEDLSDQNEGDSE